MFKLSKSNEMSIETNEFFKKKIETSCLRPMRILTMANEEEWQSIPIFYHETASIKNKNLTIDISSKSKSTRKRCFVCVSFIFFLFITQYVR